MDEREGRFEKISRSSWQRLRKRRLEIDHYKCSNCGSEEHLEVHHIVPKHEGGVDEISNLRTLCSNCHGKIHSEANFNTTATPTDTRWLPTVEAMSSFLSEIRHPLRRALLYLLAKTGITLSEAISVELSDIHLSGPGSEMTSQVDDTECEYVHIPKSETSHARGRRVRLCDTDIPIDEELRREIVKYLAIRPDSENTEFLLNTVSWGEPLTHDVIHHVVETEAKTAGLHETGAGETSNLVPITFRLFFKSRYGGRPDVQAYVLGQKEESPAPFGEISSSYRKNVFKFEE